MTTPLITDVAGFRYSVCGPTDVAEMSRLLAETFTQSDPPAVAVGLTPDEFEAFVTVVSQPEMTQGLTIIARDLETGIMAGALLTEDAASPPPDGMAGLSVKFEPIFDLFGRLDAQIDAPPITAAGQVLHLFLLGVDRRFAGRGIGQQLVTVSLTNGADSGFEVAVVEATNRTSQHIFGKLGFAVRAQVAYADYRRDGVPVFGSIADHGGPMAMIRGLSSAPYPKATSR